MRGTTFKYAGPKQDLGEGEFDLETSLRQMGRGHVVDSLQSRKAVDQNEGADDHSKE